MDKPPAKKIKVNRVHKEKHKTQQYKIAATMRQSVFDMFVENQMNSKEAIAFVRSLEKELSYKPKEFIDFRNIIEAQYNNLAEQSQKRKLVTLLSHHEGQVNEDVLQVLPFLRNRSVKLLCQPQRKERDDKIDLSFVTDFMHDYCR